jgi:uncharacterized protein
MSTQFDELVIPGLYDSGPDHWQSLWLRERPQALKVELGAWEGPTPDPWIARLDRAIARRRQSVFLIAHSLGCLAVAWWAAQASMDRLHKVKGAFLVAPPDVDRADADRLIKPFAPAPRQSLPFPSVLVASRSDRYASFASLAQLAEDWGSSLIDAGDAGHINVDAGVGDWRDGIAWFERLRLSVGDSAGAPSPARVPDRHFTRSKSRRA